MNDLPTFSSKRPKMTPGPGMELTPEPRAKDTIGTDGAAHLETFKAADFEDIAGQTDAVIGLDEAGDPISDEPPAMLSQDSFFTVFETSFAIPGMMAPPFKPMAVQPDEREPARAASDALYRLLETYYPRALMPMGDTVALLLAASPFFVAKAMTARAIMVQIKAGPPPVEGAVRPESGDPVRSEAGEGEFMPQGPSPMAWMGEERAQ